MKKMRHTVTKALLCGSLLAAAAAVNAAPNFPTFQVTPGASYQGSLGANFTADKMVGNYSETITFNNDGTFNVSILFVAGNFVLTDSGGTDTTYSSLQTGLGNNYNLYALFQGNGTFTPTSFTLTPGSGLGLQVFFDSVLGNGANVSTFTNAGTGSSFYGVINGADGADTLLASGSSVAGSGTLSCNVGNNCGSFGQVTTFPLTAAGSAFFTLPIPFYDLSLQNGQFNGFTPTAGTTQTLTGSLDAEFARVPEPATLALVGVALLGLGLTRRRAS